MDKMSCKELYRLITSDNYDISTNGYEMIDQLKHAYYDHPSNNLGMCVHAYLLRLRKEHPWVYAITVGQFPGFDDIINTCIDPEGFEHMVPEPFGPYMDKLHEKQFGKKRG